jgi:hypothetical protein
MSGVEEAGATWVGTTRSVSDRIRDLDKAGHSRAEIARMLGKRYQHVRNVLEADKLKASAPAATPVPAKPRSEGATRFRFIVGEGGTLTLDADAQAALGVKPGSVVIGLMRGESMMLTEGMASARRAQALAMSIDTGGGSMVDALFAMRRAEVESERELYG